jgi:hypothetical protein
LPVVNSEINPEAEVDPNDPLVDWSVYVPRSELGEKADAVLDTIIVIGDRWVNPSPSDIRGFLRGAPSGLNTRDMPEKEVGQERRRICTNLAAVRTILKCSTASAASPTSSNDFNVNTDRYTTYGLWQDVVFRFAQSVFENQMPASPNPYRSPIDLFTEAFRESVSRCNTEARCIRQVYDYFGAASIALPDLPFIGNINDVVNEYLQRTPFGRSLPDSPAGNLLDKYGNNTYCQRLADQQKQMGCKP